MLFFPVSHLPWISSFQEIPPFFINTILCFLSLAPFLNVFSFLSSLYNWHTTYLILARTRELNYILSALLYITTCITLCLQIPSYKTTLVELTQKRSFTKTARVGFIYLTGSVLCIICVKETMKLKNLKDIRKGNKCPVPSRES